jgi:restriction endonuclease S subunit
MDWSMVTLSEVVTIDRNSITSENIASGTKYVGLKNINSDGEFHDIQIVDNGELRSNKFQFDSHHILYGKLRPYLRKISRPDFTGICSTDILPIRCGPEMDKNFVYHYLRKQEMVDMATSRCSGANLPRLSPKILLTFQIPKPPLEEQKRIAAILDKVENIKQNSDNLELINSKLIFSKFMDMFGDILGNDAYQKRIPLDQLCEKITDGAHHTPTYSESGIPFLRVTDITKSNDSKKYISEEQHLELIRRCHPKKGDILYTKNGTIGVSKIVDWDYDFSIFVSLCLIKPKHGIIDVEYLNTYLNSEFAMRQATRYSKEATIKNLHLVEIRKILIPLPSREMQEEFSSFVQKIKSKTEIGSHQTQVKLLAKSIEQKLLRSY